MPISQFVKRQLDAAKGRKRRIGKVPIIAYPILQEREYVELLGEFFANIKIELERVLGHTVDRAVAEAGVVKADSWADDIAKMIAGIKLTTSVKYIPKLKQAVAYIGMQTSEKNAKENRDAVEKVTGLNVYSREAWLGSHIESFVNENMQLISDLSDRALGRVQTVLQTGIRRGESYATMSKRLLSEAKIDKGIFREAKTRARLIARDQIGKLNGELSEKRQKSIGMTRYRWRTALDERVRGREDGLYPNAVPSHWAREGKVFSWDKPPEGGHPGEAIQCRCYAEPVFEDVAEEFGLTKEMLKI